MKGRSKKRLERLLVYTMALLVGATILLPIAWMVIVSLENQIQIFSEPSLQMFTRLTLANYYFTLQPDLGILHDMMNSVVIDSATTVIALLVGTIAAYSLNRFRIRWRDGVRFWIVSQRMMPAIAVVLPFYLLYQAAGLYDTYWGMVLVYLTFSVPFVVFAMGGYIDAIPKELDESAMIDGHGSLGIFAKIILPLARPGLLATALMTFVFSWNELLMALVLTGATTRTIAVGAALFLPSSGRGALWGPASAIGVLLMIPAIVFALFMRRSLVSGLTLGAIKG